MEAFAPQPEKVEGWATLRDKVIKKSLDDLHDVAVKAREGIEAYTERLVLLIPDLRKEQREALLNTIVNVAPAAVLAASSPSIEKAPLSPEYEQTAATDTGVSEAEVGELELIYIDSNTLDDYPELAREDQLDGISFYGTASVEVAPIVSFNLDNILNESTLESQLETYGTGRFSTELQDKVKWLRTDARGHFEASLSNAFTPTVGNESLNRMEYIAEEVEFPTHPTWGEIPAATQEELREVLQALPIQESGYNNGLVSDRGAKGLTQEMDGTVIDMYGAQEWSPERKATLIRNNQLSLESQVFVMGKYFTSMRYTIFDSSTHGMGEKAKQELERRHAGDMEAFEREFVTFLLVNAYNAGPARIGGVVKQYFEVPEHLQNGLTNRELYFDIIDWAYHNEEGMAAGFGEDARNYVIKIYAAMLLKQASEIPQLTTQTSGVTYDNNF